MNKKLTESNINAAMKPLVEKMWIRDNYKLYITANPKDIKSLEDEIIFPPLPGGSIKTLNTGLHDIHFIKTEDINEGEWFISTRILNDK